MQLTIKTLKGEKFVVNAELSNTVAEVKSIIEAEKSELPATMMKLIYSGKVLKDTDTLQTCSIKSNAFLVVMITKGKKKSVASETTKDSFSTPTAIPTLPISLTSPSSPTSNRSTSSIQCHNSTTTTTTLSEEFSSEVVTNLTGMGFPESEVIVCLRASHGNPDVAVEFLMNGIPANVHSTKQNQSTSNATSSSSDAAPLQALRDHPQINQLRRLVQSNPQTLQAVLTQIGRQQPNLLQEINNNQVAFLQIMNEPFQENSTLTPSFSLNSQNATNVSHDRSNLSGLRPDMIMGMSNPGQMSEMIQNISPAELQGIASMMGLTPEQLTATAQIIGQMPPEQFQEYMSMAMQRGGLMGPLGGMGDVSNNGVGNEGGFRPQLLRMNEDEMAAVDRLAEMGFDRTEVVQAYLACDKNEALAANLLMDGGFDLRDDNVNNRSGGENNTNEGDGF